MRRQIGITIFILMTIAATANAEWTRFSQGSGEADLRHVAIDPVSPAILFAAGEKVLYRSLDGAKTWKKAMSLTGKSHKINAVYIDPIENKNIYVSSTKGLYHSIDQGKHWRLIFKPAQDKRQTVYCAVRRPADPPSLWIGTAAGLFRRDLRSQEVLPVEGLPNTQVYSVVFTNSDKTDVIIATDNGIYRSPDGMSRWERVEANIGTPAETEGDTTLEQFDIEEFSTVPMFSQLVYWQAQDKFLAASSKGLLEAKADAASWTPIAGENLPDKKINGVAVSSDTFYVATDRGVYRRDTRLGKFVSVSEGLDSPDTRAILYDKRGDRLIAATAKGLFRWQAPEYPVMPQTVIEMQAPSKEEVLKKFTSEPSIMAVQKAAIEYAEVHPDKINNWRQAATKKALLPSLSLHGGEDINQNIDLDRGGTNDPDRFIQGPEEKSFDWYVTASWDLGDLVWNDDQTSIDTRSRLMVELREDVLNEVTHLYYERRRLQIEMTLSPAKDLPLQLEKEIRLSELTAQIDALTGGYFSKALIDSPPFAS